MSWLWAAGQIGACPKITVCARHRDWDAALEKNAGVIKLERDTTLNDHIVGAGESQGESAS